MTNGEEPQARKNREIVEALRAQFEPALAKLVPETEPAVMYSLVKSAEPSAPVDSGDRQ